MKGSKEFLIYLKSIFNVESEEISCTFPAVPSLNDDWICNEKGRLELLFEEEKKTAKEKKFKFIAGADEAGRGPIAGPVVAAAVVFDKFRFIPGLNDSKLIGQDLREYICRAIKASALSCSTAIVDVDEINRINILNASLLAMREAVYSLTVKPDLVYVDGPFEIPDLAIEQKAVIKGDSKVFSIAAASVLAKVTRDRIMAEYDKIYPGYNFSKHKGYCTKEHIEALVNLGPSPIHRKGFAPVKCLTDKAIQLTIDDMDDYEQ